MILTIGIIILTIFSFLFGYVFATKIERIKIFHLMWKNELKEIDNCKKHVYKMTDEGLVHYLQGVINTGKVLAEFYMNYGAYCGFNFKDIREHNKKIKDIKEHLETTLWLKKEFK